MGTLRKDILQNQKWAMGWGSRFSVHELKHGHSKDYPRSLLYELNFEADTPAAEVFDDSMKQNVGSHVPRQQGLEANVWKTR